MKILIVEDEELYADQLEMLVEKMEYEPLAILDNSVDVLAFLEQNEVDLILMDVNIQGNYDGIELADMIQKQQPTPVIFITSLKDDMTFKRALRTQPYGFLIKPFSEIQLQREVELCVQKLTLESAKKSEEQQTEEWENDVLFNGYLFVKIKNRLEKIALKNILFLEADGLYCKLQTNDRSYLLRMSMTELSERLPIGVFLQTHRSFLVNTKKITAVDLENSVIKLGDFEVSLSKRNRTKLLQNLDWVS